MAPQPTEVIVTKRRVGVFSTTDLESVLRTRQVTCLVLLGIATSGVVLSMVRWAADADYALVVLEDCCADGDEDAVQGNARGVGVPTPGALLLPGPVKEDTAIG